MGGEQNINIKSSWEQDIYWNHFQFNHFVQFLSKDFHQRLALPQTFSHNVKKKLPQDVSLKGPSGAVWNIMLTTRDDIVYFADGWQQFAKDHALKENDFLVFKYNGESVFEVLVFDRESLCEKATSYFVGKYKGCCCKEKDTNNISNAGVECGSPATLVHLNNIAEPSKTTKGKTSNDHVESCPKEFMPDAVTKTRTQKKRGRPPKVSNSFDDEFGDLFRERC